MEARSNHRMRKLFTDFDLEHSIRNFIGPRLRRLMNFVLAAVGLLLLLPFFLLIGILIKLDSPGPVFYWGQRVGKKGRPFNMLKFRTMYERQASYQGPRITGNNDRRITPIGQWLRDTKLNELPQLWNVLKGEMNLVGPRPEDPDYIQHWSKDERDLLLCIHPGMTSPASIVYRDEEKMMQSTDVEEEYINKILPSKLRLDQLYVQRRSVVSDLDIILWTMVTLLPMVGARKIPDQTLYWGPISRFATRHFSWFIVDTFVAFLAFALVGFLWRSAAPLHVGLEIAIILALIMAIIFSLTNAFLGLSRMMWSRARAGYVLFLFFSSFIATTAILLLNRQLPSPLPNDLLLAAGVLAWLGFVIVRYRLRLVSGLARHWLNTRPGTAMFGERVLIIGAGGVGRFATTLLNGEELMPAFAVVGMVDDDPRMEGLQLGDCRILGSTKDIETLVSKYDVDVIVFAIAEINESEKSRILHLCRQTPARIVFLPDIVYTIKSRFQSSLRTDDNTTSLLESYQEGLAELDSLLQSGQISAAQDKIQSLQIDLEHAPNSQSPQ